MQTIVSNEVVLITFLNKSNCKTLTFKHNNIYVGSKE